MEDYEEDDDVQSIKAEELEEISNNYLADVIENTTESLDKYYSKKLLKQIFLKSLLQPEDLINCLYKLRKSMSFRKDAKKTTKIRRASYNYEKNEITKFYQVKAEMLIKDVILKAAANVYNESMAYIRIIVKLQSIYRGRIARLVFKIRKMNEDIIKEEKKLFKNKKIYNIVKRMVKIPAKGLDIKGGGLLSLNQ